MAARFADIAFAVACVGLGISLVSFALHAPNVTGLFDDDAVYQVTAKSIADGHGYVRLDRPGDPHQTKYPPLYPLILAALWNIGGGYPGNIAWLRIPGVISAVAMVWLGVRYISRSLPLGQAGAVVLAVMCLTLPELRLFSALTMSEMPFAALAFAALILVEKSGASESVRGTLGLALAAGSAAGLAFLTRTVGITLIVAVIAWLLWRRRWRAAAVAGAPAILCVVGWMGWCGWIAARESALRSSPLLQYDLNYNAWIPHSLSELLQVARINFGQFAFIEVQMLLGIPGEFLTGLFQQGSGAILWHGLAWAGFLCVMVGFVSSARSHLTAGHLFLALYSLLSLAWPFGPNRFIIPVVPLIAGFMIAGVTFLLRKIPLHGNAFVALGTGVAAVAAALTLGFNLYAYDAVFSIQGNTARLGGGILNLEALHKTADYLRREAGPDAVVACRRSSLTWLASGRKTVILMPYIDPVALHYSSRRELRTFYLKPAADEMDAARRESERLDEVYRQIGVTHLVHTPEDEPLFATAVETYLRAHMKEYAVVWSDKRLNLFVLRRLNPDK